MTLEHDTLSSSSVVLSIMREAGLSHLTDGFASLSLEDFKQLMIQDYERYGVFDVEDKQALFKVVKDVDRLVAVAGVAAMDSVAEIVPSDEAPRAEAPRPLNAPSAPFDPIDRWDRAEREATTVTSERETSLDDSVDEDEDDSGLELEMNLGMNLDLDEDTFLDVEDGDDFNLVDEEELIPSSLRPIQSAKPKSAADTSAIDSIRVTDAAAMPRIRVIVRKRPLNSKEEDRGDIDVIHCDMQASSLTVYEPKTKVDTTKYIETHDFKFDDVFDTDVDNDQLYIQTVRPLISTVFKSGRATCFAYGQTGSGKTYTMEPLPLRAAADIFQVAETVDEFHDITLHVSCFEIYGGKVFDLLGGRARLEVREDAKRKVQVVGLKEVQIKCMDDLSRLCQHAACARSTGSTGANDESSRSHSVMTFAVKRAKDSGRETSRMAEEARISRQVGVTSSKGDKADKATTVGKLSFIDLAGSERGADTYDNDKQTRLEGAEINKSLLALKECIRALDMDAGHVPFRGSKLTSVLRDSFIGKNARTVMIANVSPCSSSCEHTLNTLRYADRVKEMKKDEAKKKSSSRRESMVDFRVVGDVAARLRSDSIAAKLMQSVDGGSRRGDSTRSDSSASARSSTIHAHRGGRVAQATATDVIEMHRQHIEDIMGLLRREMDLLGRTSDSTSPTGISMDEYARELKSILQQRAEAIKTLQVALETI